MGVCIYHRRKQLRLNQYDYAQSGAYFVTLCAHNRMDYFASSDIKEIIIGTWQKLSQKFPYVILDEFVVMSDHMHGIVIIENKNVGGDPCVAPSLSGRTHGSAPTLFDMMRWFKTMTTNYYIHGVNQQGWPRFEGKLWQRSYHDRVIRDDHDLQRIREYIINNPYNTP